MCVSLSSHVSKPLWYVHPPAERSGNKKAPPSSLLTTRIAVEYAFYSQLNTSPVKTCRNSSLQPSPFGVLTSRQDFCAHCSVCVCCGMRFSLRCPRVTTSRHSSDLADAISPESLRLAGRCITLAQQSKGKISLRHGLACVTSTCHTDSGPGRYLVRARAPGIGLQGLGIARFGFAIDGQIEPAAQGQCDHLFKRLDSAVGTAVITMIMPRLEVHMGSSSRSLARCKCSMRLRLCCTRWAKFGCSRSACR